MARAKRFLIILIKPSHYDDDGYVIQWFRSPIPSNSLASVYSLIDDCRARKILGDDVDIEIDVIDETNTVVRFKKLIQRLKAADRAVVCLVGVQSNQFPRAVDIGRTFLEAGIQVVMGGFHAAGSIAMLPETPPEIVEAQQLGISIYAGEAEGRMDEVSAGGMGRRTEATLQSDERFAGPYKRHAADPAREGGAQDGRGLYQLRRRPRLPVPMLVLHDHQRAGPQVAPSHA